MGWGWIVHRTVRALMVATLVATSLAVVAPPAAAEHQFLDWPGGRSFARFYANAAVMIDIGAIDHITGCSPPGSDDDFQRAANVYVVPSGTVEHGDPLVDVAGIPNVVLGASDGSIVEEIIGFTKPSGAIGEGLWAVVYDECQDGVFDATWDALFDPAFEVAPIPTDVPPSPAIAGLKDDADEAYRRWTAAYIQAGITFAFADGWGKVGAYTNPADGLMYLYTEVQKAVWGVKPEDVALRALLNGANHYKGIAADPPRADFDRLTPVFTGPVPPLGEPEHTSRAGGRFGEVAVTNQALSEALLASLERYQGADASGNGRWALVHARAVRDHASLLASWQAEVTAAATDLGSALTSDPRDFDGFATNLAGHRAAVEVDGFDLEDRRTLANLGIDDLASYRLRQTMLALPEDATTATDASDDLVAVAGNATDLTSELNQLAGDVTANIATLEADARTPDEHPQADAGGPYDAPVSAPLDLDATASTSPSAIVGYDWDLDGDGDFSDASGPSPTIVPAMARVGLVGVRVTNEDGFSDLAYAPIEVAGLGDPPTITEASPADGAPTVLAGDALAFEASVSDPDGDPVTQVWMLDGVEVGTAASFTYEPTVADVGAHLVELLATAGGETTSHSWIVAVADVDGDDDGWQVHADCDDGDGDVNPAQAEIVGNGVDDDCDPATADELPPEAAFTMVPSPPAVGETITFTAAMPGTTTEWDFGDGSDPVQGDAVEHSFAAPGTYPVTLTVTDDQGSDDTVVPLRVGVRPTASFDVDAATTLVDAPVAFTDTTTDDDANLVYRRFDFGDGSGSASTGPSHAYASPGAYTVRLTVQDADGLTDSTTQVVQVDAAPVAAFDVVQREDTGSGATARFEDASTDEDGTLVGWSWDFGDGAVSDLRDPEHTYAALGTYAVTLTVTDDDGHTAQDSVDIVVGTPPTASFAVDPATGDPGDVFAFTDQSSAGSAPIAERRWDFGDGTSSTETSPSHAFAAVGAYDVSLRVTDINGASDVTAQQVLVSVEPPTADFTPSAGPRFANSQVTFTDTSTDSDGTVVSWAWDFGDGTTSSLQHPGHAFPAAGTYRVNLTVTDDQGARDNRVLSVLVFDDGPTVDFTVAPSTVVTGDPATFTSTSTDPDGGTLVDFAWDFHDGSGTDTGPSVDHTFPGYGQYLVSLTVTDDDGNDRVHQRLVAVNAPPVADFDLTLSGAPGGASADFEDLSVDVDGAVVAWSWDFGDGSPSSTDQHPNHVFADPGEYTVTLTVTDDDGTERSADGVIDIAGPPTASFAFVPHQPDVGESVTFTDLSTDPNGVLTAWSWDFDDATGTVTDQHPTHTFTSAGVYDVTLTVTDDDGDSDVVTVAVPVGIVAPVAAFTTSITGPDVDFTDASTDADGTIVAWSWDFGDGSSSTAQDPSHTYTTAGSFSVTLTVTDDTGAADTTRQRVTVDSTITPDFSAAVGYSPSTQTAGGEVIAFSSQGSGGDASNLIDQSLSALNGHWRTANGAVADEYAIIELAGDGYDVIDTVTIATLDSPNSPQDVVILTSTTGTDEGDFSPIAAAALPRALDAYDLTFSPVRARYVKFLVESNHGGTQVNVAEVTASTRARDGGLVSIAGGHPATVLSVSSNHASVGGGPPALIDGSTATGWTSASGDVTGTLDGIAGAHATIALGGPSERYPVEAITLQAGGSGRPGNFRLQVSTTTADDGAFQTVLDTVGANTDQAQTFPLATPVDARYVRLLVDDVIGGGSSVTVNDLDVHATLGVNVADGLGVGATVVETSTPNGTATAGRAIDWPTDTSSCTTSYTTATASDETLTILLSEHDPTVIDRVVIHGNGTQAPANVEVLVSTTGYDVGDFTSLGTFALPQTDAAGAVVRFDPVEATYVKLRLVDSHGASTFRLCTVWIHSPSVTDLTVPFDNLTEAAGAIDAVAWDFGDGEVSSELHPVHTYATPGTYVVTLTVTSGSETAVTSLPVEVFADPAPQQDIAFRPTNPPFAREGDFIDLSSPLGYGTYSWHLEFPGLDSTANSRTTVLRPPDNGVGTLTLSVTDHHGQVGATVGTLPVANRPPTATAPDDVTLPWGVPWEQLGQRLTDPATLGGRDPLDCSWDFDDGGLSGLLVGCPDVPLSLPGGVFASRPGYFPHAYAEPGIHTPAFHAFDDDGGEDSDTSTVTVTKRDSLVTLEKVTSDPGGIDVVGAVEDMLTGLTIAGEPVTLSYLGDTVIVTTDGSGDFEHRFANPDASSDVTASWPGNAHYEPSSLTKPVDPPHADIVILFDTSGSMSDELDGVLARLGEMVQTLSAQVDVRFSVVAFPDPAGGNAPRILTPLTADIGDVAAGLNRSRGGGGIENGFAATTLGFTHPDNEFRSTAGACAVLFTDEDSDSVAGEKTDALAALAARNAPLFAVALDDDTVDSDYGSGATGLGPASGGAWFDITAFGSDPQPILDAILASCLASVVRPDLVVTVDDGIDDATRGDVLTTTITVDNLGGADAEDVALTAALPAGVTPLRASDRGTITGADVTWPPFDVLRGGTVTRTIEVVVPATFPPGATPVTTSAEALPPTGPDGDRNPADNVASDETTIAASNTAPMVTAGDGASITLGAAFSLAPATFTDVDLGDTHTATVDWGDGVTEPGSVTGSGGAGSVAGAHTYSAGGTYEVEVCVTDTFADEGCDTLEVQVDPVDAGNATPLVDAGPDRDGNVGRTIVLDGAVFTDTDLGDTHTATIDWGDGTAEAATVGGSADAGTVAGEHTYATSGLFVVQVCVTDSSAAANATGCDTILVAVDPPLRDNAPPVVDAGPGAGVAVGEAVRLAPASISDPDDDEVFTVTIDWGDGTGEEVREINRAEAAGALATATGTEATVDGQHAYGALGDHVVEVCATDAQGEQDCDQTTIAVQTGVVPNFAPLVSAGADRAVTKGATVTLGPAAFTDANSDDVHAASIDWGDGAVTDPAPLTQTEGGGTVAGSHPFGTAGVHTVEVCVTDDSGEGNATGCDSFTVTVAADPSTPVVSAGADAALNEGNSLVVAAGFTDADGGTHTATIDWGDGTVDDRPATGGKVSGTHVYADDGTFTVRVCVTDVTGRTGCDTLTASVANVAPTAASLDDRRVEEHEQVVLDVTFSDPGADTVTVAVDWGDGAKDTAGAFSARAAGTSGTATLTHAYTSAATYLATVTLTDDDGGASSFDLTVIVVAPHVSDDPVRQAGGTRIQTAIDISKRVYDRAPAVVLARSDVYADALAGAALAHKVAGPILLTPSDALHADVATEIGRLRATTVYVLGGVAAVSAGVAEQLAGLGLEVVRIGGDNRFATAALIADRIGGTTAFVAEGANANPFRGWPDVLSAASISARLQWPILLVTTDHLPPETATALQDLGIEQANIVGGTSAVSVAVEAGVADLGVATTRYGGVSRYDTSRLVAELAESLGQSVTRIWTATGAGFADALAAGPAAAAQGGILVLVHPETLDRSPEIRDFLAARARELVEVVIVGGPAAVSERVASELDAFLDVPGEAPLPS